MEGGKFITTRWSRVLAAGRGASTLALEEICAAYWRPLYVYARRRGAGREEAEDLVQGFFVEVLERGSIGVADPSRGRFRSFLLTAFRHHVGRMREKSGAVKRGGRVSTIALDAALCETDLRRNGTTPATPEQAYHREWALTILSRVMARLRSSYEGRGKGAQFDSLKGFLDGSAPADSRAVVARELGLSEGALRVALHRLRERYRTALLQEVSGTLPEGGSADDEIRALFTALEV